MFHLSILSEIPQGSIFGLLVLLIFVNDIPDIIKYYCVSVDDTKCLKMISSPQDFLKLQEDLNKLSFWSIYHAYTCIFYFAFQRLIVLLSFKGKFSTSQVTTLAISKFLVLILTKI